jgi:hypothetical protein
MSYFGNGDYNSVLSLQLGNVNAGEAIKGTRHLFDNLHHSLYPFIKKDGINLHPNPETPDGVGLKSVCVPFKLPVLTLTYTRSDSKARAVENMMGRNTLTNSVAIETHRHLVIELRLSPDYFTIELVMSPSAWYDQQNLTGLLTVEKHRERLYRILSDMAGDYFFGFWGGIHLDDMHLNTVKLPSRKVLFQFLDTFAARRDWWRIGCWYKPQDPALHRETIVKEAIRTIGELYKVYDFILWKNTNNYISLYQKAAER